MNWVCTARRRKYKTEIFWCRNQPLEKKKWEDNIDCTASNDRMINE
jgi:hypothetical protein